MFIPNFLSAGLQFYDMPIRIQHIPPYLIPNLLLPPNLALLRSLEPPNSSGLPPNHATPPVLPLPGFMGHVCVCTLRFLPPIPAAASLHTHCCRAYSLAPTSLHSLIYQYIFCFIYYYYYLFIIIMAHTIFIRCYFWCLYMRRNCNSSTPNFLVHYTKCTS